MQAGNPPQPGPPQQGPGFPQDLAGNRTGFLSAPPSRVGVLTPPDGTRVAGADDGPFLAGPSAARYLAPAAPGIQPVRPGHGLDGPEITSSWPAQPSELDSYEEFWRQEGDGEHDYANLFGEETHPGDEDARTGARRRTGRRRGRSNDHRLWLALGGVVITAAAAIVGIVKFEFPSHSGPVHAMATPARIGSYVRTVGLEREANVAVLRNEIIKMSSGQATKLASAVYESGNSAAGGTEQIVMLIEGHLANADPAASIASFRQQFRGASVVSPGALGGQAACVEQGTGSTAKSVCVWFDNDSFGVIVSPTMNSAALANVMHTFRPAVELVTKH
jgi:hypothetical protein